MGKTASRMSRPLKNWNVENRAHKVISKEKPSVAPSYESMKKQIELVNQCEKCFIRVQVVLRVFIYKFYYF